MRPRIVLSLLPVALAIIAALALILPSGATASHTQEMILQDDSQLIYSSPSHVAKTLRALKGMGVDRVRVSVVWSLIAPKPTSSHKPKFNATNPTAYPTGAWARWDFIDQVAKQYGIGVYFQPTAPAPTWATTPRQLPQGYRWSHNINATDYGQFVQAVGKRYDGSYVTYGVNGQLTKLPAVRYWGIYNEPNIGGWMTPQWSKVHGVKEQASPAIYRRMLDAAWNALVKTGHRHDTILIGETAAYGAGHKGYGASMDPLTFIRALYCVGNNSRPLTGNAAAVIGCPSSGNRLAFTRAHPGLFYARGWAHHPYDFTHPPSYNRPDPNSAPLADMGRLERTLDSVFRVYHKPAGIPIYITEWGVQSRGPDPYIQFSQAQQAEYLNQGEYMAWTNPRIKSFAQFLLVDDAPLSHYKKGSKAYWGTFQSGLLFYPSEKPKPAYYAFELPIWLPHPHHGKHVYVWAQIRPATGRTATFEFRPHGSNTWSSVATVTTKDPNGILTTHLSLPAAGSLRMAWRANGTTYFSRTAPIT
jgi:hypothetical protein